MTGRIRNNVNTLRVHRFVPSVVGFRVSQTYKRAIRISESNRSFSMRKERQVSNRRNVTWN